MQAYSITTAELSQENLMLKRLNEKAFNRIHSLEARINDLLHENNILVKRVSTQQRNEGAPEPNFTDYFQSSQMYKSHAKPLPVSYHTSIPHKMPLYKEEAYPKFFEHSSPYAQPSHGIMGMNQIPTPETAFSSDSQSNMETFWNADNAEVGVTEFSGSQSQSLFDTSDSPFENRSHCDDYAILGKRKFHDENCFSPFS